MPKKTKKQKQRAQQRRSFTPETEAAEAATAVEDSAALEDETETAVTGESTRRRVERVTPGAAGSKAAQSRSRFMSTAAMVAPLESDDPAIPFDRVPYVPADLRRVAIMAAIMLLLIVIADIVVSNVVK